MGYTTYDSAGNESSRRICIRKWLKEMYGFDKGRACDIRPVDTCFNSIQSHCCNSFPVRSRTQRVPVPTYEPPPKPFLLLARSFQRAGTEDFLISTPELSLGASDVVMTRAAATPFVLPTWERLLPAAVNANELGPVLAT